MENPGKINLLLVTNNALQSKQFHDLLMLDGSRLFKVFPADSMLRVKDYFSRRKFDLVIVDESFREDFWKEFEPFNSQDVPVYYLALESYTDVESLLSSGYRDVLFKPVDLPIIMTKIAHDAPKILTGKFLSSVGADVAAQTLMDVKIEEISECGAILSTPSELPRGTRLVLTIPGKSPKSVTAEVIGSAYAGDTGVAKTSVIFRGIQVGFVQDMRKFMRSEFVKKKFD